MTGDEAQSVLFCMLGKGIFIKDTKENQAILVALKALEKEPILGKIKAEIEQTGAYYQEVGEQEKADAFLEVLRIIDEFTA